VVLAGGVHGEVTVSGWLVLDPSPAVPVASVDGLSGWLIPHGISDWDNLATVVELLNVVLFVPAGATLGLLFPRLPWRVWCVVGWRGAGAVELFQWRLLDARTASWSDVWAKTVGFGLGAALAAVLAMLSGRRRVADRR